MSVVSNIYFLDRDAVRVQLRFRENIDNNIDSNIRV